MNEQEILSFQAEAQERLKVCEEQRLQLGRPTPQEIYWGGYVDALCQIQGKLTMSNLNWVSEGIHRMFSKQETQKRLDEEIRKCDACTLCEKRTQAVPGTGPLWTPLAIVGEAPGQREDLEGIPFCGKSGELLFSPDGLFPSITGFRREHILIRNVVCCRPPGNAAPNPEQIQSCSNYLRSSLLNAYPKVIISFGATPTAWFIGTNVVMGDVRGKPFVWENMQVIPTYHPAYLLRNPAARELVEQDLKKAMEILRS